MTLRAALTALLLLGAAACSNAGPRSADEAYRRGLEALAQGQPRTARIEFLNAIKAEPDNKALRLAQARTYLLLGDGGSAEAELKRANALGVPETETGHLMAHALLLQRQPERAAAEARKAGPAHAAYANRMLGRAYQLTGKMEEAAKAFDRALAAAPRDDALWTDIADFRRATGEIAGAIEAADRAVALGPRNVEALRLRGELTRSQYGLAAAMPWFDRALEIDPANVAVLIERAATLGDLGRTRDMLADTRRILSVSENNPSAYYLQAMLAARGRDYDLARSLYRRTGGVFDNRPAAMLLAGTIELGSGNASLATAPLKRLLKAQPGNLKARRLLGSAQWQSGDARGAVDTLRPLADRADADAYTLSIIGKAYARLGDEAAAVRYLGRAATPRPSATAPLDDPLGDGELAALRRDAAAWPDAALPQVVLIRALLGRGLGPEALQRARQLQAAAPGAPDAHVLVGDALAVQGDYAGAALAYRRAANLAFSEPVALRLVEALRNSGDDLGATKVLTLFLQQNPQNVAARTMAANAYLQAKRWPEAIALYEGVRKRLGNNDATLLNNLAWAYAETGQYERAVPLAGRAWSLEPSNPVTADTLGWLLFRSGKDRVRGLALLEQASRGAPTDEDIRAHLREARGG
ncbi:MAG TPA: tetratricopeptide repeat protein [Allosphingosinicella sp.]|nr:tetratricopeptide repeat protein [Allosphingosinicella sp.]